MNRSIVSLMLAAALACASAQARADEPAAQPAPTKHQMMKDCMAKQKASDGGMPKQDMKKNCKDVTKTESENAKAEKETADEAGTPPHP
jgi:hypothetical protein